MNNHIEPVEDMSPSSKLHGISKPKTETDNNGEDDKMSPSRVHDDTHDDNNIMLLPPITTETLPTIRQSQIACQSWDTVSARQPLGSPGNKPDKETFVDFVSTILETRLADVVKHRREVKALGSRRSSRNVDEEIDELLENGGDDDDAIDAFLNGKKKEGGDDDDDDDDGVLLTSSCRSQLRAYVRRIASMYRDNRYHALEHAVHVTMSANKLLDMLHEGGHADSKNEGGENHDDEEGSSSSSSVADNDFTMSEPCIMRGVSPRPPPPQRINNEDHHSCSRKPSTSLSPERPLENNSSHSATSENGYRKSAGGYTHRKSSLSGDFDDSGNINNNNNKSSSPHHHNNLRLPTKRHHHHKPRSSTYLIYSDMFTKFAFVVAAMIHDVDHQGVPNARLVLENDPLVETHGHISVAEKHSIKVAFRTLSEPEFDEFRSVVFESPDDQLRMHRIVTNVVVSTDIASPERMQNTKVRWEEAFVHTPPRPGRKSVNSDAMMHLGRLCLAGQSPPSEIATVEASKPQLVAMKGAPPPTHHPVHARQQRRNSLKRVLQMNGGGGQTVEYFTNSDSDDNDDHDARVALRHSVVIETMLNVADVAHSMQSWELFLFWNGKLFEELYVAYKTGRSDSDPRKGWYNNQLGFYRLYVIPLAEKMKTCGVFGEERGGEWVENAISIRDRWTREGEKVTEEMIASVEKDLIF